MSLIEKQFKNLYFSFGLRRASEIADHTTNQKDRVVDPCPNWYNYNNIRPVRDRGEGGQKDGKTQKNRKFAGILCLL